MTTPKRGLGRGLDALLGQPRPSAEAGSIRVDAIRPNPQQPRQHFDAAALNELEQSVRELGVLVPIIVRPLRTDAGVPTYELIAGERRWRAAAAARLSTIPAIVRDADDRASLEMAVVENLQRQDLDPLEEAMGFSHLIDHYDYTQERLADRVGRSRPAIANALRLLALSDAIKARVREGSISVGHARALLSLEPAEREKIAARVATGHLTVRQVERLGQRSPAPRKARAAKLGKSADVRALEARLRYALGAPVSLVAGARGGRIEIRYGGESDLSRLIDLLLPEGV